MSCFDMSAFFLPFTIYSWKPDSTVTMEISVLFLKYKATAALTLNEAGLNETYTHVNVLHRYYFLFFCTECKLCFTKELVFEYWEYMYGIEWTDFLNVFSSFIPDTDFRLCMHC